MLFIFFFFNDTATTEIYTLSLHDALPISPAPGHGDRHLGASGLAGPPGLHRACRHHLPGPGAADERGHGDPALGKERDRKSTRLNSSHSQISYAVFCLKKKK